MGRVGEESGAQVVGLRKEQIDLEAPGSIEKLMDQVAATPGCASYCALERKAWTRLNASKNSSYVEQLKIERDESRQLVLQFVKVAAVVIHGGGEVPFEWPPTLQDGHCLKSWPASISSTGCR